MTDRSNDAPGDDLDATRPMPASDDEAMTIEEAVEEAPDLTDAQLGAASDAAEAQVEYADAVADAEEPDEAAEAAASTGGAESGEPTDEAESGEAETEAGPAVPARPGARARAAEAAAARAAAAERGAKAPKPTRTTFPIDPALRINDPASAAFVAASILFFILIFANAMAFGRGGAFRQVPTPAPVVSPTPAPSVSPGPTDSAAPSGSPAASPVESPAASEAASATPSTAPTAPATGQ